MTPLAASEPRDGSRPDTVRVAVLAALAVVLEALAAWHVLGPVEHTLLPDDAFYYLCVGRNLAEGLGPTFDGVYPTTGFQPLWQAVVALVALGPFDSAALPTAVAAVNLACLAAAVGIVAVAGRRRKLHPGLWTLTVIVAFANPYVLKTSLNGMESGLVWLVWSLALIVLTRSLEGRTAIRDAAAAGAIAGMVVLTRLDGLGLVLALACVTATAPGGRRVRALVAFAVALGVVAGPYFAWLWIGFGHWLPVSVLAKTRSAQPNAMAVAIVGLLFAAAIVVVAWRARAVGSRVAALPPAATAATLAVLAGLLPLAVYAVAHRVRLTHLWYYPGALTGVLLLAALVASALWARGRRAMVGAVAVAGLALAAGVWTLRLAVHKGDEHYRIADAMGRRLQGLPGDVRIAGWNVGLVAYRRSCRVTNLDGLVNSYAFVEVLRERRLAAWLDREGITGLVDYFDRGPRVELAERDPALPGRVSERFRLDFDYAGPLSVSGATRRRAFIYFDYRPANPTGATTSRSRR
jgi:hypothetical protein